MHLECGLTKGARQLPGKGLNLNKVRWIVVGEGTKHWRKHGASRNDMLCRETLQNVAHTCKGLPLTNHASALVVRLGIGQLEFDLGPLGNKERIGGFMIPSHDVLRLLNAG